MITPYFTKFHARIVFLCKYFLRIIITCYPCIIITEIGRNRIRKVVTEYLQIITPCGRKFISFCPQVRRVHLRRSGTIYSGKLNTIGKHINSISHINVSGKIQTIVEHRQICTNIPLMCRFPSKVLCYRRSDRRIFRLCIRTKVECVKVTESNHTKERIKRRYVLVSQTSV